MASKVFHLLLALVLLATINSEASAGIAELLNDVEESLLPAARASIMTNSLQEPPMDHGTGSPCHVEFQVTKRKVGRCVELGRGAKGCVSGTYLNPFHPDCM